MMAERTLENSLKHWGVVSVLVALIPGALLSVTSVNAAGPISVRLRMDNRSVLRFESVPVVITLTNESGRDLEFGGRGGKGSATIRIEAEIKRYEFAPLLRGGRGIESLRIKSGESRSIRRDISRWYDLSVEGRYIVKVVVGWKGREFASNSVMLEVVRGIVITSLSKSSTEDIEDIRVYSLRYWARNRREYLFVSVNNEEKGINYGVFLLGTLVRVFKPTISVTSSGDVQVSHQATSDRYTKSLLASKGDSVALIDQTHYLADGRPYPFKVRVSKPD